MARHLYHRQYGLLIAVTVLSLVTTMACTGCQTKPAQRLDPPNAPWNLDSAPKLENGYGYLGSTPQNTTQSSGTGGPSQQIAPFEPGPFAYIWARAETTDNGELSSLEVEGFPEAEAAARSWFESLEPLSTVLAPLGQSDPATPDTAHYAYTWRGLLVVGREVTGCLDGPLAGAGCGIIHQDTATFRLADAHQMELSDYFYDGVNYIDFINHNLLNQATNQVLASAYPHGECGMIEQVAPFSGLPNNAASFNLRGVSGQLVFFFPANNPFLRVWPDSLPPLYCGYRIPLMLPADLSPYGLLWSIEDVQIGNTLAQHLVTTYQGPDPHGQELNQKIDTWLALPANQAASTSSTSVMTKNEHWVVRVRADFPGSLEANLAYFDYFTGQLLWEE